MKEVFKEHKFSAASLVVIDQANAIITEYQDQGFDLTLRQIYYQMVARDLIDNTVRSYKRSGGIISNGRLAGYIDWKAIVDRTRHLRELDHWASPVDILQDAEAWYHVDMWENQKYRPEVWIEKDALIGVITNVCQKYDVPFFACRGYVSQSAMYKAGRRMYRHVVNEQHAPIIIHLGDHDPSGMDMTRDNLDRLTLLSELPQKHFLVKRIALNWEQVRAYNPPPNPTKLSDSRAPEYIQEYGLNSWELDALEPKVIVKLIQGVIEKLIEPGPWENDQKRKQEGKDELRRIHENYDTIIGFLGGGG